MVMKNKLIVTYYCAFYELISITTNSKELFILNVPFNEYKIMPITKLNIENRDIKIFTLLLI